MSTHDNITVYTAGTRANVYHKTAACGRLQRDEIDVRQTNKSQAEKRDLDRCGVCYGTYERTTNGGGLSNLERILRESDA